MKIKWVNIRLWVLLLLMIVLCAFTVNRNNSRLLTEKQIIFTHPEQPLISEQTVNKLLIQNKGDVKNIRKEALDLNKLEHTLNSNQFIKRANLYVSVNGQVGVNIEQKTPIARIQAHESFYIDEGGKWMPTSPEFSIRVPIVTGKVDKKDLSDLFKVMQVIAENEFLKKQIEGVVVRDGKKYTLLMRLFEFEIDLGTSIAVKKKLNNFIAFYKKATKDKTIKTYSKVNLQIASQVVCTKK